MLKFVYNWFVVFGPYTAEVDILESVKVFCSGSKIKAFACQIRISLFLSSQSIE